MESKLKINADGLEIVYDVSPLFGNSEIANSYEQRIAEGLADVNNRLDSNQVRIDKLSIDIDRLTNHADELDYLVAVGSGVLAGLIDSFWVGEFNLARGKASANEQVNKFVVKIAKMLDCPGDDLKGAITSLENKFPIPSDSNMLDFGGGLQHRLRDFAHHPTPVGLFFSLLTQFTSKAYGTDVNGVWRVVDVKNTTLIGKDIPQKVLFGVVHWFFHLVSDMAGSRANPGAGTGIPGPLLSLAKELSALPFFKNIKIGDNTLSEWISQVFNKGFDLRAELGVANELGRQAVPVVINECVVRGFYFIRRLSNEIKEKEILSPAELDRVDWEKCLPFKNRTIARMLTISTGTFVACDLTDAAIRAAIKSGGNPAAFGKSFLLHINFVGIGRFVVAVVTDIGMGIEREKLRNERIAIMSEQLTLNNAKSYYLIADAWHALGETTQAIVELAIAVENAYNEHLRMQEEDKANLASIDSKMNNTKELLKSLKSLMEDF